jgi:hypothetical protein
MPYTANVPQGSQRISDTQTPILNNFQSIQNLITVNHVDFDLTDQGKHNFVSMPVQAGNPGTTTYEMALYTKTSALSSVPEMFIQRDTNGAAIEFTSSVQASPGWTRVPSGILFKWGVVTGTGNTTTLFPVAGNIPVFANIFSVMVSVGPQIAAPGSAPNTYVQVYNFNVTQFDSWCSTLTTLADVPVTFRYLAIGN